MVFVGDDVLKDRTEVDGAIDLRLFGFLKVDALCIAPALEVEYAVVGPAVLVIADQLAVRVS